MLWMRKRPLLLLVGLLLPSCQNAEVSFTVTWVDDDGTVLETDRGVKEGSLPHYDGATPSKPADDFYTYPFLGWDKDLAPVTADVTYTATYGYSPLGNSLVFSHKSGFYDEPISLSITAPEGYEVFYSLDNADPDETSSRYVAPLSLEDASEKENYYCLKQNISPLDVYYPSENVDKCHVLKVVGIDPSTKETTPVATMDYFVGFDEKEGYADMPVIVMSMDEDDLFDYERGIYVTGKIYDESEHTGYPETYPANYNQKGKAWERKANIQCFNAKRGLDLDQNVGIRIHGGWTRAFNQKSFNIYARKDYGSSTLNHAFFDGINAHSLMLRSGGYRDSNLTKTRDSMIHDLSVDEPFDVQRSMPVILFLNGEYWGIYNLQERYSEHYVEEHRGTPKKNVLIIQNDELDEGEEKDFHLYEELKAFFQENDFGDDAVYEQAKSYLDMEEFASYMATELYVGNIDWPGNNVRLHKDVSNPDGVWHFMMYDTDDSSGILPSKCAVDVDPFLKSSHWVSGPMEEDCLLGLLFSKLCKNPAFRHLFRKTFRRIGAENFGSGAVQAYLEAKENLLALPMENHYERFVGHDLDAAYFQEKVAVIREFFDARLEYALSFLDLHVPE